MKNSFRQLLREYFRFSNKDRRGILLLISLIFIVITATIVIDNIQLKGKNDFSEFKKALSEWGTEAEEAANYHSLFTFNPNTISEEKIDSLLLPAFVKRNILNYRKAGGNFDDPTDLKKIYGMNDSIFAAINNYISIPKSKPKESYEEEKTTEAVSVPETFFGSFDPNIADEATFKKFGFNNYQVSNIIKYRQNGGSFSAPHDVLKIYGVDSAFYKRIEKHIQIEYSGITTQKVVPKIASDPEIFIELNSADSAHLIKLQGVGSVFASRIIKYRNLLGGFYSTKQLLEVYNFPEETYREIEPQIFVDQQKIQPLRLNFANFGELIRHPYLEEEHVKAILDYRNTNGAFQSVEQLEQAGIIEPENFRKIKPYLSCS